MNQFEENSYCSNCKKIPDNSVNIGCQISALTDRAVQGVIWMA